MNADLERVIRLQELEDELRQVREQLEELPREREQAESRLAEVRSRLEQASTQLEESQRSRRQHEGQLQDLESRRSRLRGQLMDVKTNKEYTAMLHEIETVEREISKCEDLILVEMERADELQGQARHAQSEVEQAERHHAAETKQLGEKQAAFEQQAGRVQGERDEVAQTLPEELRTLFERVAGHRGGAVAEARDGVCLLCRFKLRPQLFLEVKRNDAIRQCDACSRILYYSPPVPVVAPAP